MSTNFWKILKLSPALLGASLLVAGSAYASENSPEQKAEVSDRQATANVEPMVALSTGLSNTQVEETPVSQLTTGATSTSLNQAESSLAQQLPAADKTVVSQATPTNASSSNPADSTVAQQVPAGNNTGTNSTEVLEQLQQYTEEGSGEVQDQVTNVTQLTDVRPTDWAYEALRSLVERYGCIVGYPDRTYRGNRALSRYEFAAGLNACLNQIERLIASSTADFVRKSDLETLQRLVQEFRTELTALGARVDKLEGRVAFLEDNQFSTTTKLNGEVIFAISNLWGDNAGAIPGTPEYRNTETVFQDRVRLNFDTSFTGKDRLRTRLQAGNVTEFGPLRGGFTPGIPGTNITREGRFGFQRDNGNNVELDKLWYRAPLGNLATVHLFANAGNYDDYVPLLNPNFDPSGTGALSRYGRYSPIYRMGGQGTGFGLTFGAKSPIRIDLGYMTDSNVGTTTCGAATPEEKCGLFDGNYSALGQVTFQPIKNLSIAGTYVNNYDRSNLRHGTGSIRSQIQTGRPVVGNSYGVEASFAFTPQLVLSGWGSYTNAIVIGTGNADVWQYGATLAINDIGSKGSTLGFAVGMEPKLAGSDVAVANLLSRPTGDGVVRRRDRDTGLHVEGFYKFKLSDNILITPGVIWLTAPGHDSRNDDIFIGTLRTTFTF
jgi:hypothetical protein